MQYLKLKSDNTIIEFHNNWLGEETVIVHGQIVSKISSIWGADHQFIVTENGKTEKYVLTSRFTATMQVTIDLRKNGKLIYENLPVGFGTASVGPRNQPKLKGIQKVKNYDLEEGIEDLIKALDINSEDPEIYFYLACAYSLLERSKEGYEALKNAVAANLQDTETILNHDMLAWLRLQEAFEGFLDSNFTEYDENLLKSS